MERVSGVYQDLGYGDREKSYRLTQRTPLPKSSDLSGNERLALPPLIIPQKMPEEILGSDYDLIKGILVAYKKSGMNWDDYAKKLEPSTSEILKKCFYRCRCNGFFNPVVVGENIEFSQLVKRKKQKPRKYELTVKDMEEQ